MITRIDNVRIINRALTVREVQKLYVLGQRKKQGWFNRVLSAMTRFLTLILALSSLTAQGANWFIVPGGAGALNGTSWSNAAGQPLNLNWNAINPGDTLWLAGGSYVAWTWPKSGAPGGNISLCRATASSAACTGSPGWSANFDSQVIFTVPYSNGFAAINAVGVDFITIDGKVPNGIKFVLPYPPVDFNTTETANVSCIKAGGNGCIFRNLEFQGAGVPSAYYGLLFGNYNVIGLKTNLLVSACYAHDISNGMQFNGTSFLTVELCEFARIIGNLYNHDNVLYVDSGNAGVLRNNYTHEFGSTGFYFASLSAPGPNGWKIYGNVFQNTSFPSAGKALTWDNSGDVPPYQLGGNWQVYNNTIVNVAIGFSAPSRFPQFPSSIAGGTARNNIFWHTSFNELWVMDHDYDFTDAGAIYNEPHGIVYGNQPFVNLAGNDLHLVSTTGATWPRAKGVATIPEVSPDKDGVARANPPSIGAYEYAGGGPTPPPAVPGTLAWSSANYAASETGGSITLTVSRNVGTDGVVGASYSFVNGTAVAGHDYTGTPGTVSLGNGVSTATIVVPILNSGDTSTNARTFSVVLSSPTGGASLGPPTTATVTIVMVPPPPPPLIGLASFPTFTMDQGTIVAPCFLTNATQLANLANTDGAGSASYQVVITNAGVYWLTASVNAPNTAQNSVRVDINRDPGLDDTRCWDVTNLTAGFESRVVGWRGNGTFAYDQFQTNLWSLSPGTNTVYFRYRGEAIQLASVTFNQVTPPPPPPYAFLSWDTPGPINYQTSDQFTFHLLRSGDLTNVTTVDYLSVDGSAKAGINYIPVSGTFTFASGVSSVPLTLKLLDTGVYIPSQYFSIVLTNASANATIMQTNLTVTILQAAPAPVLRAVIFNNVKLYNVVKP